MDNKVGAYELADILGCKAQTIYTWIKKGVPHTTKYQGIREVKQFDVEEVKHWLADQRK